jgi:oxygen-dependent protoporphyrinogen oxidase
MGSMVRSRLFSPLEKLRMALDLVLPRGRTAEESIGGLLRRRLGDAAVDRLAGPLLGGIYAGDADALSTRATFPKLVEWEARYRSLILAALALRRQNTTNIGGPPSPMFLSLVGGLGELIDRLAASLGDTAILTGRKVTHLTRQAERRRRAYTVLLDEGTRLDADAVVLATPAYVTAKLLEPLAPAAAGQLRTIPYVSTAAVTLAYQREAIRHPLGGNGFVVARGEPLNITACTWISSKWPNRAPEGVALLRCFLGAAGSEAIVEEDDRRLIELAQADLRATMGVDANPLFTSVARWPASMPQYPLGHLERLEIVERELQTLPGIGLAGACYRGIGIPDCIRQGTEAARRLTEGLSGQLVVR